MKMKIQMKISLILFLIIELFSLKLYSQTSMYVKEYEGIQSSYKITALRKLSFSAGNLEVVKSDGVSNFFELAKIRYINFVDLSLDVPKLDNNENINLSLFPNPVINELNLKLKSENKESSQIEIINIQGKCIKSEMFDTQQGENNYTINVKNLPVGLYFCRIVQTNKIQTIKFIKN